MAQTSNDPWRPPEDAVWFLPLGGSGEIGMNLNLYGTAGKWLMVDCGITFPDEMTPGIEIITPDPAFITARRNDLVGLVVTHGHEDHLGAIEYLWTQFKCPVYATEFTAGLIRAKMARAGLLGLMDLIEVPVRGRFDVGPFDVEMVGVTHSIPESHMLAIRTRHGTVLHTGDWKLDPDPVVGPLTDEARLQALGREGVMAVVGDSTNAIMPGHSPSERGVQASFMDLFGQYHRRIVVTCFSSNIARLTSIQAAARQHGREVALVGRSLWRNAEIAEACGYMPEFENFINDKEAMRRPRDKVVLVCTGSQGELRAALPRIAALDHQTVELERGDVVMFSSRDIPGNEKAIARVQNLLLRQGIEVLTIHNAPIHASGHPYQEELRKLYGWIKPGLCVPVHGEFRHQTEHARIAQACGVLQTQLAQDGQILRLGPGAAGVVGEVPVGRLGLDGKMLRPLGKDALKNRRKIGQNGAAIITLALNRKGIIAQDPQIALPGLAEGEEAERLREDLAGVALDALEIMAKSARLSDAQVRTEIVRATLRYFDETCGKRPHVDVHLIRV